MQGKGRHNPGGDAAPHGSRWGHSPRAALAFLTKRQPHTKAQWVGGCWVLAGAGVIREECRKHNCFPSLGRGCRPDMAIKGRQIASNCWRRFHVGGQAGRGASMLVGGLHPPVGTEPLQAAWGHWPPQWPHGAVAKSRHSSRSPPGTAALERTEVRGQRVRQGVGPFLRLASW